jgi:hypothetical protein
MEIRCILYIKKSTYLGCFIFITPVSAFTFLFLLRTSLIFTLVIMITSSPVFGQVYGCTDAIANNYNAAATVNNGTCTCNTTTCTPPKKVDPISDSLVESSGLQWAGNALWSFNDGSGSAAIYRIDTLTNALLQRVYL